MVEQATQETDVDKLFSDVGLGKIPAAFTNYVNTLNGFYKTYNKFTAGNRIATYGSFDIDEMDEQELLFVSTSLKYANYDENSLQGENIVLFKEPIIVSELQCKGSITNGNSAAIRLISHKGEDKKVVTLHGIGSQTPEGVIANYRVYDVVVGFILPSRCELNNVSCASFQRLLTDHERMKSTQLALTEAEQAQIIEKENISNKLNKINESIKSIKSKYESLAGEVGVLEQEKERVETSIISGKVSLDKVRKDFAQVSVDHNNLIEANLKETNHIDSFKLEAKSLEAVVFEEKEKAKSLKADSREISLSLMDLKGELAEAEKEKNLTTLDMVGHKKETDTQVRMYYFLAALVFSGIAAIAVYLYGNGKSFVEVLPLLANVSAWDIILSRLPLVAATTIIVGGLSGMFVYLVKHIVSLNTEKMMMLKAAIIAEQASNSIGSVDMTDKELFEFKRDTKIKLIMEVFSEKPKDPEIKALIIEVIKAFKSK